MRKLVGKNGFYLNIEQPGVIIVRRKDQVPNKTWIWKHDCILLNVSRMGLLWESGRPLSSGPKFFGKPKTMRRSDPRSSKIR